MIECVCELLNTPIVSSLVHLRNGNFADNLCPMEEANFIYITKDDHISDEKFSQEIKEKLMRVVTDKFTFNQLKLI